MQVKKFSPKKAQILAEANETLKSVQGQVLPEFLGANRQETASKKAQGLERTGFDPKVHKQEEAAKLLILRRRLQTLQAEELQKARQEGQQAYQAWSENTSEAFKAGDTEAPEYRPAVATGSKKSRVGVLSAIKSKVTKSEIGRKKG